MADPEKVAAIRALMPATGAGIYLNAGSAGPIPAESQRAMDDQAAHELAVGRASGDQFAMVLERQAELRAAIAAVLVADPDDIAITHSTTDGMNLAINALPWQAGDRAITTRHEHLGGVGPLLALRDRLGIEIEFVDIGDGGDDDDDPRGVRGRAREARSGRRREPRPVDDRCRASDRPDRAGGEGRRAP